MDKGPNLAIRFNVNDKVRVKLTERGHEILRKNHEELFRHMPMMPAFTAPAADADGWSDFQLWCLMREFGPHIFMGGKVPFETEIELTAPAHFCDLIDSQAKALAVAHEALCDVACFAAHAPCIRRCPGQGKDGCGFDAGEAIVAIDALLPLPSDSRRRS